jgi:signal transduction histidine kinase
MDAGWGKLEGFVKADGTVTLKLTAKKIGTHNYALTERFEVLRGVRFEIAWIPGKKEYFRDTRTLTKGLADLTREQGGVRVYLDGFRIYPYGNPGDDWLGIDKDVARRWGPVDRILEDVASGLGVDPSRAMLRHPQNRHLIGRVYISSYPRMQFAVKADREGFVENETYDELIKCIRLSLQWFTLHYNKFLLLYQTEALKEAEKELRMKIGEVREEKRRMREIAIPLVKKAVDVLSMEAKRAHETLPEKEKKISEERVEAAAEVIQRSFTQAETYLSMLRAVASTGALMFVFSHEIKVLIGRLDTHANTLSRIIEKLPQEERDKFKRFAQSLRDTRDRFDQQVKLFEILTQKTADTQRKRLSIKHACNEVLEGFEYLIDHYHLNQPKIDVPDSLMTAPMLDAELFSIIVNIISNAVKATIAGHGKNILIQGRKEDGKTVIRVFDDGIGISEDFREAVFQPLTADPDRRLYEGLRKRVQDADLAALGRGSGLGLSIVRGIAETYGGTADFVDVEPPWKTCIKVVLP